jgi:HK97 family phage major capsid protein
MAPKVPIPVSAVELEEMLSQPARMQEVLADPESLKAFFKNYAQTVMQRDTDLNSQLQDMVKAEFATFLRDHGQEMNARTNALLSRGPKGSARSALYREDAPGARLDSVSARDFYRAIWHLNTSNDARKLRDGYKNAFSSNIPSSGGFLVPESIRSTLAEQALEQSVVRPRAMVVPMEAATVGFPVVDDTTHNGSVLGGMIAYWAAEGDDLTDTSTTFRQVKLEANTLTMYTEVPNQLLQDSSASLGAFIDSQFPRAQGFFEDIAFLTGNGVGQPLGVLNAPSMITVSKEAGQLADTIVWQNLLRMFCRLLPNSIGTAVWVISPGCFFELATMALSVGTGGSAIWLNNGVSGPPMTILGRPVIISEKVPKLGDAADITLIDFAQYLVGDRMYLEAMSSPHYKFQSIKTAYRFIQRVDGRPWLPSALTPANGGDTLGAYIRIEERA